jgi:hypothetical protein
LFGKLGADQRFQRLGALHMHPTVCDQGSQLPDHAAHVCCAATGFKKGVISGQRESSLAGFRTCPRHGSLSAGSGARSLSDMDRTTGSNGWEKCQCRAQTPAMPDLCPYVSRDAEPKDCVDGLRAFWFRCGRI